MIKFKEQDGELFRMLDKPVPLTADAEMPCLVRLIQDDSPMGRNNKNRFPSYLEHKFIIKELDDGKYVEIEKWFFPAHNSRFEIIGYPVDEGSAEWALYQMMQGEKICHHKSPSIVYCKHAGDIRRQVRYNCVDYMSTSAWLNGADKNGWQLYKEPEPKPLLADAKVGDLCKRMDGKWVQIETLCSLGGMPWICYEIGGLRYINNGEQLNTKDRNLDIIDYHPLAPEGSDEWAWQMAKLGIETKCIYGKIRISDSGMIEVCYNGMAYAMPLTQSAENRKYVINKIRECSPDGWQLYKEPKPEPAPKFKVGDWVEVECKNGTKKWTEQCKVICIYRDGDGYGVNFHGNHQPVTYDGEPFSLHLMGFVRVVRKLSHSEVVVPITISGTVRQAYNEDGTIDDEQFQLLPNGSWDGTEMFISFDALDSHTRKLVESLLKAQEEE